MKKWKKSHRERKRKRGYVSATLILTIEEYNRYNKYRIEHNYSWDKLIYIAINNIR